MVRVLFGLAVLAAAAVNDGYIGVQIKNTDNNQGVTVMAVIDDAPAARAGLKADDVVLKFNDKDVNDVQTFVDYVRGTAVDETVVMTVRRDGKEIKLKVKVGKRP